MPQPSSRLSSHASAPPINVFTVDLEEWFQGLTSTNCQPARWDALESRVVVATEQLLAILAQYGVQATFFVLGHVADRHPALIERIAAAGHEIGIHGYWHRFVYQLTSAEFAAEIEQSIAAVARITGQTPQGHRAPYFSVNATTLWAFTTLAAQGLRYDSSVFPIRNMLYGFPGAPRLPYKIVALPGQELWELPASTVVVAGRKWPVAGGFYMRAMPYAVTRAALRRLNRAGEPAMIYIHPWEIDLGQHYNQVTPRERITHYQGRRGLVAKLHRLFTDFRFAPMCALVDALEGETPVSTTIATDKRYASA